MEVETPPEPPDPGEFVEIVDTPCAQPNQSRKRAGDNDNVETASKKHINGQDPSAPSIQTLYVHPSLSDSPKTYSADDKGPYIVYVTREVPDPSAGTSIRAINFGQFLHKHKVSSILNDGVKNAGRNKVSVEFTSSKAANDFLCNPVLNMTKYQAYIPTFNVTRMGLVRGVPSDWHLEEFVHSLELPAGCGEVLKARRLNRKQVNESGVTWVPTQSVVLTFRGQILPSRVFSYHTSLPIETYRLPTIQCVNCCRFGHVKAQCRSTPRCYKCSQAHSGDTCSVNPGLSICILCSGKHQATDKSCPEHARQQSIKVVMSDENLSYQEASLRFPPVRPSYAEMAREMFTPPIYSPRTIPNYTSSSQTPSKSYRQTVFRSPRPKAPLVKGYDRLAHNNITRNIPSSQGNGCALNTDHSSPATNENLISDLTKSLSTIIEILSQNQNQNPIPSNVAQIFIKFASALNNGLCSGPSVEL